ncbi:MAG: hydantoinase/oxoprolinase family protein [Halanaeroarchaeum sp.]
MIIGIDTGGTNVDAALVAEDGVRANAKVENRETTESIEAVLEGLLAEWDPDAVDRVVVATTLVVNAAVQERLPAATSVLVPGPGLAPSRAFYGEENLVADGSVDPRGRVTEAADLSATPTHDAVAITAKFAPRNPAPERAIRDAVEADAVALGSESGAGFSFPERAATTVANAKAISLFRSFESDVDAAVDAVGIDAPVYYLKGDGAMLSASSMAETPAQSLRGGSAASALGLLALSGATDAVAIDVGGTTTDVTRVADGYPAVEGSIPVADIEPAYEGVVSESLPLGGDTRVVEDEGEPSLASERAGNAVAFGGPEATLTDALHVLDVFTEGDEAAARRAIASVAPGDTAEAARTVLDGYLEAVATAVGGIATADTEEIVGGGVLAPHLVGRIAGRTRVDRATVPDHADVAGAVGCGVARVSVETAVHADSARGVLTVAAIGPETVESIDEGRRFTDEQVREIAGEWARDAAERSGGDRDAPVEVRSLQRYSVVESSEVVGQIFDANARVEPGLEYRFAGGST